MEEVNTNQESMNLEIIDVTAESVEKAIEEMEELLEKAQTYNTVKTVIQVTTAHLAGIAVGGVGTWFAKKRIDKKKRELMYDELSDRILTLELKNGTEEQMRDVVAIKAYMIDEIFGEDSKMDRKEKNKWKIILQRFMAIDSELVKKQKPQEK